MSKTLSAANVLIVVQNLPVPFDRRVWQEALALGAKAHSVTVICPADDKHPVGTFHIDGIEIVRYPAPPEGGTALGYIREYALSMTKIYMLSRKIARMRSIDIVHICNPPDFLYLSVRHLKKRGTRLIFDQHDLGPELVEAKEMPLVRVLRRVSLIFERITYSAADHVIATNSSYRSIALTRGKKNTNEVTIVRSGPRAEWVQDGRVDDAWRRDRRYLIGYVGVMGKQDGIQYLLRAVKHLIEESCDVQLALVGSGPDVERLKNLAGELGIADRVEFHGRLSDEDLRSVLASADVCVNPDEVNKMNDLSTMNKIVEYMAMGRPIVQFDVMEGKYSAQSAARYARPNSAVSLAEEIKYVLEDETEARRMAKEGRERFSEFLSWEAQIPYLYRAYETVLSVSPRYDA
ncbi:glycosyltransferase family 4 protein [Gordonia jacobaea]|uniref:Glycosyltransferase subfamily 4-like N-terminal domain-containing protein n=1 Tax=Gordonia jacobaea TaxID=122202 RepID=A0ABR5I7D3_9ACTN|nr:glycosyltransferase family 4 protein [Gordonia jacobaea]KNA89543.1 hypothetical protein ABW18_20410 [Gordonia jacobaea]